MWGGVDGGGGRMGNPKGTRVRCYVIKRFGASVFGCIDVGLKAEDARSI